MANFPPQRKQVQTEQVETRDPVSESLIQSLAGPVNHLQLYNYMPVMFKVNSSYKTGPSKNRLDGFFKWKFNAQIINVTMFNGDIGTSGTTEADILLAHTSGGVFTSIFSTTPKITPAATSNAWVSTGEVVGGCTAPILTTTPLLVSTGDVMICKLLQVMAGNPVDFQIQIDWLPR